MASADDATECSGINGTLVSAPSFRHIDPVFGDLPLGDVTPAALEDFRALLTRAERDGSKALKMKTARDIIDGTFRALYRDARTVDRLVTDDPFAALHWPRKIELEPDPFPAEERDKLLDHFRYKDAWYFPLGPSFDHDRSTWAPRGRNGNGDGGEWIVRSLWMTPMHTS